MSSTRNISQQEWELHSATIEELYYERKLPLKSTRGEANIMDIMDREHRFSASTSQYEAFFKTLNKSKNLKKEEWRAVFEKEDEIRWQGMETRITISGQIIDKRSLKRRRRHAMAVPKSSKRSRIENSDNAVKDLTVPIPTWVTVEAIQPCNHTSAHAGSQNPVYIWPSPPMTDPLSPLSEDLLSMEIILEDAPLDNSNNNALSVQSSWGPTRNISPLPFHEFSTMSPYQDTFFSGVSYWQNIKTTSESPNNLVINSPHHSPYFQPLLSPLKQILAIIPSKSRQASHSGKGYSSSILPGHTETHALDYISQLILDIFVSYDLRDFLEHTRADNLPDIENILGDVSSLIVDTQSMDNPHNPICPSDCHSSADLVLQRALLFSITNGFSGFDSVPSAFILKILKKQPQIFDFLRQCSLPLVRSIADNLFRAAVEALDEQAVKIILEATQNTPNALPLDDIICYYEGKRYTPIELAALFRHLGIVILLLAAKVDTNKTYNRREFWRGPLELAISSSIFEAGEPIDAALLSKLLSSQLKIRAKLVIFVLNKRHVDVAQELVRRFPIRHHLHNIENVQLFIDIADCLPNLFATETIQRHFLYCHSEDSSATKGPADYPELVESILWHAALKANSDLVIFLLQYANQRAANAALAAAIKNGTTSGRALFDLLLKRGASIDKDAFSLGEGARYVCIKGPYISPVYSYTTSLAEAIRQKYEGLVQLFEERGALFDLKLPNHFEAAMNAAAEIGDIEYMQKLFKYAPKNFRSSLRPALESSMKIDKTEAILLLLEAGAMAGNRHDSSNIIRLAIVNRNKVVFEKLLESDVKFLLTRDTWKLVMEWEDLDILKDLVLMSPARCKERLTDALEVAVICGYKALVSFFIEHRADINRHFNRHIIEHTNWKRDDYAGPKSPLAAAISNGDKEIVELLLSHGANPADPHAFFEALRNHKELFPVLLQKFREQNTIQKKGVGADSLIEAISRDDSVRFSLMLQAGFDVNSLSLFDSHREFASPLLFAIKHRKGKDLGFVRQLLHAGADPNQVNVWSDESRQIPVESPLLMAVKTKSKEMVELLLAYGADIHRPARRGLKRTPLQQACEISCCKIVMLLLSKNVNVNEPPAERGGGTALQFAAISGNIKIFRLLLSRGAKLHGPTSSVNGRTALEGAAEHGRLDMITEIWNAASGEGFSQKEIDNAKRFAKENGYLPCADYVATLSSSASFAFVPEDPWMGFGSQ